MFSYIAGGVSVCCQAGFAPFPSPVQSEAKVFVLYSTVRGMPGLYGALASGCWNRRSLMFLLCSPRPISDGRPIVASALRLTRTEARGWVMGVVYVVGAWRVRRLTPCLSKRRYFFYSGVPGMLFFLCAVSVERLTRHEGTRGEKVVRRGFWKHFPRHSRGLECTFMLCNT